MGFLIFIAVLIVVAVLFWDRIKLFVNAIRTELEKSKIDRETRNYAINRIGHQVNKLEEEYQNNRRNALTGDETKNLSRLPEIIKQVDQLKVAVNSLTKENLALKDLLKDMTDYINKANATVYAVTKYSEIITGKLPDEIDNAVETLKNDTITQQAQKLFNDKVTEAAAKLASGAVQYEKEVKKAKTKTSKKIKDAAAKINTAAKETNNGNRKEEF